MVDDMESVSHGLGGVVDIALQIHERGRCSSTPSSFLLEPLSPHLHVVWPLPMYMSSRIPMTSAMKETILAVSRTVSPWAIGWFSHRVLDFKSKQVACAAKLKRVG